MEFSAASCRQFKMLMYVDVVFSVIKGVCDFLSVLWSSV